MVHPSTDFAEEPHVKAVAIGLRRTNPLLKAYSDTWDITIIFDHIFEMARRGEYLRDLPHYKMRPWLVALLKLRTSCRSGDIAPGKPPTGGALDERRGGVFRAFYPQHRDSPGRKMGLRGNYLEDKITHMRFHLNKTVAGQASYCSKWFDLGDYLVATDAFPHLDAACPRRLLEAYYEKTQFLPTWDDYLLLSKEMRKDVPVRVDLRHGRAPPPRSGRRHYGISAQTASKDCGKIMQLCGVPARFRPHSTRHASLSKKAQEKLDQNEFLQDANLSAKVFKQFYFQPIVGCDDMKIENAHSVACFAMQRTQVHPGAPPPPLTADGGAAFMGVRPPAAELALDSLAGAATSRSPAGAAASANALAPDIYTVGAILDRRGDDRGPQYKVLWEGFPLSDATWEPVANLSGAREAVAAFEARREAAASLAARRVAQVAPRRRAPQQPQVARKSRRSRAAEID